MARVTIEDCIKLVPNRFDLVLYAGKRTRDLYAGAPLTIERNNSKNPVVALREIAQETVSIPEIRKNIIRSFQKNTFMMESTKDHLDEESQELLLSEQQDWKTPEDITGLHIEDEDELQLEEELL